MKKRLLTIAGCVILVACAVGGWVYYSLVHISIPIAAVRPEALIAFKGSLGEVMFGNLQPQTVREGTGLDALLASAPAPQGEGLISAYQKDPERFKRYAQLFDTAVNAERVGQFVQANRSSYNLPLSSSALPLGDERLDAWGHPYCVTTTKSGVAVVSRGKQAVSFDCKRDIPDNEIMSARRLTFQTTGGQVVVLVGVKETAHSN